MDKIEKRIYREAIQAVDECIKDAHMNLEVEAEMHDFEPAWMKEQFLRRVAMIFTKLDKEQE